MNDFRIRQIILILLLSISTAVVWSYLTIIAKSELENLITEVPLSFDDWIGKDLPIKEKTFNILETRSIIVREYHNRGNTVTLAIIYHASNESTFHSPEACLGGIGYTILDEGIKKVQMDGKNNSIHVRAMQYYRNGISEQIYYFYQTGNVVCSDYSSFRWKMLLNQLRFQRTNGALIRISVPIRTAYAAKDILADFLTSLLPHLFRYFNLEISQRRAEHS